MWHLDGASSIVQEFATKERNDGEQAGGVELEFARSPALEEQGTNTIAMMLLANRVDEFREYSLAVRRRQETSRAFSIGE